MQKDQLLAEHTIPPSHSGRQASSRRPCCHKESAVASGQPNLSGQELTERHRRLCVSETSLSAPPIEAQGNQQACRQPCSAPVALSVSVRIVEGSIAEPIKLIGTDYPYSDGQRTLQVDAVVLNKNTGTLGAYEVKRGAGLHDSGKQRSMLKDALCIQVLLKHYAKQRGYDPKSVFSHFGKRMSRSSASSPTYFSAPATLP